MKGRRFFLSVYGQFGSALNDTAEIMKSQFGSYAKQNQQKNSMPPGGGGAVTEFLDLRDGDLQIEIAFDLVGCYEVGCVSASCAEDADTDVYHSFNWYCASYLKDTALGKDY